MFAMLSLFLSATPQVGDIAPDFTVTDTDGTSLTLSKLVERGNVVLAFFPRAFTGGWTRELSTYRDRYVDITKSGATVIAISNDPLETQKKFKESLKAPFPFVADEQNAIIDLYDLKGFFGTKRISYVIGKGRKVLATQDGLSAINPGETVQACSLHPPETLKHIVGPPTDAGSK